MTPTLKQWLKMPLHEREEWRCLGYEDEHFDRQVQKLIIDEEISEEEICR